MLYADAHCHSNPLKGLGARLIAKKFREYGGWFIALISLPPYHYGFSEQNLIDNYKKVLDLLVSEKKRIVEEGLKVKVFAGFHPAEVDEYFRRGLTLKETVELADRVLDLIIDYHRKGLIDGLGEVGRQHYSTSPSRLVASELIMLKALELVREYRVPIHLHLEQGGYTTVESIRRFLEYMDVPRELILLHHVDYETGYWSEENSMWYTVPAKEKDLSKTMPEKRRWLLIESDFIDDPRRPGVSSYPWNIPLYIDKMMEKGLVDEEYVYRVMVDHVVEFYGVEPP